MRGRWFASRFLRRQSVAKPLARASALSLSKRALVLAVIFWRLGRRGAKIHNAANASILSRSKKYPLQRADLQRVYHAYPELSELTTALVSQWPTLTSGLHRLHFDQGRVTLTLVWGDSEWLPKLATQADAFYLDGFSPAKNPELWCDAIYQSLARLAAPNATLATYTVAGHVRRGLMAAGFAVEKQSGFADKRHRLAGHFTRRIPDRRHTPCTTKSPDYWRRFGGLFDGRTTGRTGW